MKLLILGGYGTFGGRLAQLLADEPRLTLLIGGRSFDKAAAFCARLAGSAARLVPMYFNRNADLEQQIHRLRPDWLVDATGPFQAYGDNPYRVVKACIACAVDYMDLADGSAFVRGVARFDPLARQHGVTVLAGVSSFPVLTAAVVRRLSTDFTRLCRITAGIAPSPFATVGPNVIRAIAGYAGQKVRLVRGGRSAWGWALTETQRYTVAPPGCLPLRSTRFSLVDVPDLQLLPALWPELDSVWIGAGPVPEILQRLLNGLAWLVRLRLLPGLSALAPVFHWVICHVRWGEHRGGMFVSVRGVDRQGREGERSWHLLAEGDAGPLIPSMAAEAIIRRSLDGIEPAAGARPALEELELSDYEALFDQRGIHTGQRLSERDVEAHPLYRRLLGSAWHALPAPLREIHECGPGLHAAGLAEVERGRGWLSRLVGACFGFPARGRAVPVRVSFRPTPQGEVWQRTFAGRSFSSSHSAGHGRSAQLLCEQFGPFRFGMALVVEQGTLRFIIRRWSLWKLPLPAAWAPHGDSHESAEGGCFHFHVEIRHRWTGLLVAYRGWLMPVRETVVPESVERLAC